MPEKLNSFHLVRMPGFTLVDRLSLTVTGTDLHTFHGNAQSDITCCNSPCVLCCKYCALFVLATYSQQYGTQVLTQFLNTSVNTTGTDAFLNEGR